MRKMMLLKKPLNLLLATILLLPTSAAIARKAKSLDELMNQPKRPTMMEIKESYNALTALQAFMMPVNGEYYDYAYWLNIMIQDGPRLIATLEKAFPGATWAFMGRDTAALADLVEAFYISIGQNDRVVRLGGSKASYANIAPSTLVNFLESNGFSLNEVQKRPPYILIDTVSKGYGQQGRALLSAVYEAYTSQGHNPLEIVRKFNMIGLIVSTFARGGNAPVPIESADLHYNDEILRYAANPYNYQTNNVVVTFTDSGLKFNEAGYEHFTGAWHTAYGAFAVDEKGSTQPVPGAPKHPNERMSVLLFQRMVWESINNPLFLSQVQLAAKNLGYEFPLKRPFVEPSQLDPKTLKALDEGEQRLAMTASLESYLFEMNALLEDSARQVNQQQKSPRQKAFDSKMQKLRKKFLGKDAAPPPITPGKDEGLTPTGKLFYDYYTHISQVPASERERFSLDFLRAVRIARKMKLLKGADVNVLFEMVIKYIPPSHTMVNEVMDFARQSRSFRKTLKKYSDWDREQTAESMAVLQEALAQTPNCVSIMELNDTRPENGK